jgi:hypothetical protein
MVDESEKKYNGFGLKNRYVVEGPMMGTDIQRLSSMY